MFPKGCFEDVVLVARPSSQGQLGLGDNKDRYIPFAVSAFHTDAKHSRVSSVRHICLAVFFLHCAPTHCCEAVQVSCGARHAAAVTSSGRVYTWGDGSYGQLGHDDHQARFFPTHVGALTSKRVAQAYCTGRSTIVVLESNEVIAWGMTLRWVSMHLAFHCAASCVTLRSARFGMLLIPCSVAADAAEYTAKLDGRLQVPSSCCGFFLR